MEKMSKDVVQLKTPKASSAPPSARLELEKPQLAQQAKKLLESYRQDLFSKVAQYILIWPDLGRTKIPLHEMDWIPEKDMPHVIDYLRKQGFVVVIPRIFGAPFIQLD